MEKDGFPSFKSMKKGLSFLNLNAYLVLTFLFL